MRFILSLEGPIPEALGRSLGSNPASNRKLELFLVSATFGGSGDWILSGFGSNWARHFGTMLAKLDKEKLSILQCKSGNMFGALRASLFDAFSK